MEAKRTMMAAQNVVPLPTAYHDAPFLDPRDVPDTNYIRDRLCRIDPATNISYRKDPESDISNAQLLAKLINGRAVYVEGQGWYVFCGGRWCFDKEQLRLMIICQEISKQLVAYINELPMDEGKKKYLAAAKKWDKPSYRKKLLEDAASKRLSTKTYLISNRTSLTASTARSIYARASFRNMPRKICSPRCPM